MATADDFGDELLKLGMVSKDDYNQKQIMAEKILSVE